MELGEVTIKRKKAVYVGAPAIFALELACRQINEAFDGFGCYLVGSALERPDWRDVDIRYIMKDEEFESLFPDAGQCWEQNARWLLMTTSISDRLSKVTGLPVDFQFQPMTHANERHKGRRHAIGMVISTNREETQIEKLTQALEGIRPFAEACKTHEFNKPGRSVYGFDGVELTFDALNAVVKALPREGDQ